MIYYYNNGMIYEVFKILTLISMMGCTENHKEISNVKERDLRFLENKMIYSTIQKAMEEVETGNYLEWKNCMNDEIIKVTISKTHYSQDEQYCREFNIISNIENINENLNACRNSDGKWNVIYENQ